MDWATLVDRDALASEPVAPGVLRLWETPVCAAERSYFYLVTGRDRDLLIDGGWGFAASLDAIRDPAKPLAAFATHSHFDHIGMLYLAGERYGHAAEAAMFVDPDPVATQALPYLDGLDCLADGGTIAPASIRQNPCPLTGFVGEGDTIDLGGRVIHVLHTPGHSPGSLCAFDEKNGLLFCADTVHDGHIWDDIPGADRAALAVSHARLEQVDFALALPGHGSILTREAFLARIERYRHERDRGNR